ncbi:MAG: hypothetical protein QW484_01435 [Candidatus Pacearchaeota archaeon]
MRKIPDAKIVKEIDKLFINAKKTRNKPKIARRYVAKARKLAKRNNFSLKKYRKLFCHKCNSFYSSKNSQLRIKKGNIIIKCLECGNYARYVINKK